MLLIVHFIYNNFINIAPIEEQGNKIVYNNSIYRDWIPDFPSTYKADKCLGIKKGTTTQVYTVKNDLENDYLIFSDMLYRSLYIKESKYQSILQQWEVKKEQHQAKENSAPIERQDGISIIIYNGVIYKQWIQNYSDDDYKTDKCLGEIKDLGIYVYTVENDKQNDYLILEGMLICILYIKESIYQQYTYKT